MHTHLLHSGAIVNLGIQDSPADGFVYSAGLHPWHLEKSTPADWDRIVSLASDPKTVAIGETGLDRVCSTPISLQTEFFLKHIELARQTGKPLIVHCVRATDLLLNIKKKYTNRLHSLSTDFAANLKRHSSLKKPALWCR